MIVWMNICAFALFFALMICAVRTDIKSRTIPNWVIFSTVFLWLAWRSSLLAASLALAPESVSNAPISSRFVEGISAIAIDLAAALTIFAILIAFTVICEKALQKHLFGGGDIKLVAASTLFLGPASVLVALFFACLVSMVYALAKLEDGIPFAPCMLCGSLLALMV